MSKLVSLEQAREEAFRRQLARIRHARDDVNAYIEYTEQVPPRNIEEGGGTRWAKQDLIHTEWQAHWGTHRRSITYAPVGTGKSTQVRKHIEHKFGNNHDLLVTYISSSELLPKKQLAAMQATIETNERVKHVFPTMRKSLLRQDGREVWSSKAMLLARELKNVPDPSMQIFGAYGKILGSRSDLIVLDDFLNYANTLTQASRDKLYEWLSEVLSRLKPGARVICVGHTWNEDDPLNRLTRQPQWQVHRSECFVVDKAKIQANADAEGDDADVDIDPYKLTADEIRARVAKDEIRALSPSVMGIEDILEKVADLPGVFALLMLFNRTISDLASRFKDEWFELCLRQGRGLATRRNPDGFEDSWHEGMTYTGVDLGHRRELGSDQTVLFTIAVLPDGTRRVIDVRAGLWKAPEILHQIQTVHAKFGSIIAVENNAAQNYLLEFAADVDTLPITAHKTTGTNKYHFAHGVESIGVELSQGKWMFPCDENLVPGPMIEKFIKGCKGYDPIRHTSDFLMAAWICRECIRQSPSHATLEEIPIDLLTRA